MNDPTWLGSTSLPWTEIGWLALCCLWAAFSVAAYRWEHLHGIYGSSERFWGALFFGGGLAVACIFIPFQIYTILTWIPGEVFGALSVWMIGLAIPALALWWVGRER